jgi:hypothetical protein
MKSVSLMSWVADIYQDRIKIISKLRWLWNCSSLCNSIQGSCIVERNFRMKCSVLCYCTSKAKDLQGSGNKFKHNEQDALYGDLLTRCRHMLSFKANPCAEMHVTKASHNRHACQALPQIGPLMTRLQFWVFLSTCFLQLVLPSSCE